MEKVKHELLITQRSCFTTIPTGSHLIKKEHDYFPPFWVQWAPHNLPLPLASTFPNECKVEENPAYTYHGSDCPSPRVKQEETCRVIEPGESMEAKLQRRAFLLSQKRHLDESEREEIKSYRSFRLNEYLLKKMRRNFDKKIVYTSRKKVADRRIRFQGKFINEFQAMEMLGLRGEQRTFEELKEMMRALNKTWSPIL